MNLAKYLLVLEKPLFSKLDISLTFMAINNFVIKQKSRIIKI